MVGYDTRSRRVSTDGFNSYRLWDARYSSMQGEVTPMSIAVPTETVTSYRTGVSGVEEDDSDPIINAKSYKERFKAIRDSAKKSSDYRPGDTGHPFSSVKQSMTLSHERVDIEHVAGPGFRFIGPLWPSEAQPLFPDSPKWYEAPSFSAGYYGPKAIANCAPTNPVSDLAVTLVELMHEGLPKLGGSDTLNRDMKPGQKVGSEYLNVEFGWKPLASSIADTMYAVNQSSRLINQLRRDSGRIVRRSYVFPDENQTEHREGPGSISDTINDPQMWSGYIEGTGKLAETRTLHRKVWFSGAFTYHFDVSNHALSKLAELEQKAHYLFGLRLDPDVMWQVQPWSWLVDWQLNIGDNIKNATNFANDGLVIQWGYLMCTTTTVHERTVTGQRYARTGMPVGPVTLRYTQVKKERVKATPFGFGSNPDSFSSRQWAILGALGLTRAPNTLR